jgi:L,D-peptidoglycan transpeptidase YkuD (ErfK/YbiS/YcfS/YnhG family)
MKRLAICLVLLAAATAHAKRFRLPKTTRQVLLVTAESWSSGQAKLERYERVLSKEGKLGPWKKVGDPVDVVLGRSGLGWGYGLHGDDIGLERAGPLKQEGDGRSPAGVFKVGESLGYGPAAPQGSKLAYRTIGPRLRCVDDPLSKLYNQLTEEPEGTVVKAPWKSAEKMKRDDDLYTRVVTVEHNKTPIVPGQGSCIFLHVWGGPQATTAGCTAMPLPVLEAIMIWLDPAAEPLVVQLPQKEYGQLKGEWKLP